MLVAPSSVSRQELVVHLQPLIAVLDILELIVPLGVELFRGGDVPLPLGLEGGYLLFVVETTAIVQELVVA